MGAEPCWRKMPGQIGHRCAPGASWFLGESEDYEALCAPWRGHGDSGKGAEPTEVQDPDEEVVVHRVPSASSQWPRPLVLEVAAGTKSMVSREMEDWTNTSQVIKSSSYAERSTRKKRMRKKQEIWKTKHFCPDDTDTM